MKKFGLVTRGNYTTDIMEGKAIYSGAGTTANDGSIWKPTARVNSIAFNFSYYTSY